MTDIDSVFKIALCARAEERRVNPRHFKCDHPGCEKAYTTNQRLKNHKLAVHSGENSKKCRVSFKVSSSNRFSPVSDRFGIR